MINQSILSIERSISTQAGSVSITGAASGLPVGGTTGQILAKQSNNNYDTHWVDQQITSSEFLLQTVYNGAGTTIYKGEAVYIAGAEGSTIVVGKAIAGLAHDSEVIGVALENILNNGYGSVVIHGTIDGLNTDSFLEGERLYLSAASYGQITNVEPSAPNAAVLIGYCVKKGIADGSIYVNVNAGEHLVALHDVSINSAVSGNYLFFDSDGIWKNKTIEYTDVSGLTGILSGLYSISNPSGYITGDLSALYPRSNPSGFITGIDTSNFYTNDNPSGFITGVDTSNFYTKDNPSGFITGIQNLVYTTGDQLVSGIKTFEQGLEVGSGLGLSALYVSPLGAVGINNENPQGALDVSGSALFSQRPTVNGTGVLLNGELDTSNFYTNDNPSGFITGVDTSNFYTNNNPSGFITGVDTSNFYTNDNPSGFITGVDTSNFYTNDNPSGFITGIDNLVYTTGNQVISGRKQFPDGLDAGFTVGVSTLYIGSGVVGVNNENPLASLDVSGSILFSERPTVNGTGVLLSGDINISNFYTNDNLSGFITGIDTSNFVTGAQFLVYTTGDQIISGIKTFEQGLEAGPMLGLSTLYVLSGAVGINNENPQASLDVSGLALFSQRPIVNTTGIMLSGDIDISNFYPNDNPSGYITGIQNLVYTTGDQIISGIKNFIQRPTVNGTGVVLEGEVQNNTIISGVVYSAQVNIKNNHTGTLYKGQPVYINGAAGGNILVGLASSTGEASSSKTLGLIYQDSLAVNAFGTVITDGLLSNFNVGSAAAGDPIWLGPTGNLIYGSANKPVAPNHLVYLGVVTRTNNNGEVFVKVQNGYELNELHDVAVTGAVSGQFLFRDGSLWKGRGLAIADVSGLQNSLDSKQPSGSYYASSNPSGYITGINDIVYTSGNQTIRGIKTFADELYVKSTGAGQVAVLHVESGKVGINNENPQYSFDVSGSSNFSQRPTVNGTGVLLNGEVDLSNLYPISNPSGFITSADTLSLYPRSNPSGFITGIQNLVYTTGDQVVSGVKTFASELNVSVNPGAASTLFVSSGLVGINNENPQASLDVSGLAIFSQRPAVNGTGLMITGDDIGFNTISFYHSPSSSIASGLLYFSNLQLPPSSDIANRRVTIMEKIVAKKAAWSAYCATTGNPADVDYTGYFINNTKSTTGVISSSIKVSGSSGLFNYSGNINPEIQVDAGDLVSIGINAPDSAIAPVNFQNSVDIYFYK